MARRRPTGFRARQAARGAHAVPPRQPLAALPVAELLDRLERLIQSDDLLADIWVEGEVRNFSRSAAGHVYFRLSDDDSALNCAFFARANRGARIEQGDQVLAHGRISIYRARGDLQLIVDSVQPKGAGVLHAEFERMRAKLEAEGLFAPERKRPLPAWPHRIGVVTSSAGAVWHDIQNVLARRWPLAALIFSPSQVQGDGAADSIVEAIQRIVDLPESETPDLIIVGRGGGSPEDLWAYNEEPVARAIFACPIPVISAVGHETDFTIADLVADFRAPTPSAAAEIAVPDQAEELQRVRALRNAAASAADAMLEREFFRVSSLSERLGRAAPDPAALNIEINQHLRALDRAVGEAISARAVRLAADRSRLKALNPDATLARGYALVRNAAGDVLASVARAAPGDTLSIRLRDGEIEATVNAISPAEERA